MIVIKIYSGPSFATKTIKIPYKSFKFSGGEIYVGLNKEFLYDDTTSVQVTAKLYNSDDIMELLLLKEALDQYFKCPIHLLCPYLPYARQDRRCEEGESFSLRIMANLINSMNFSSVEVHDCHSEVGPALINNCYNRNVTPIHIFKDYDFICSPDAGGVKRAFSVAQKLDKPLIKADKVRSTQTGEILETQVYSSIVSGNVLIVDDICDGGRTFIELGKELKKKHALSVGLWVTHGIFSKGLEVFDGIIDEVFTTDSFDHSNLKSDKVKYVEISV